MLLKKLMGWMPIQTDRIEDRVFELGLPVTIEESITPHKHWLVLSDEEIVMKIGTDASLQDRKVIIGFFIHLAEIVCPTDYTLRGYFTKRYLRTRISLKPNSKLSPIRNFAIDWETNEYRETAQYGTTPEKAIRIRALEDKIRQASEGSWRENGSEAREDGIDEGAQAQVLAP
jgi:hypothetical protein